LTGGDAKKIYNFEDNMFNNLYQLIIAASIATSEVNASMGKIVGAPTAGSSGIIPGVIWSLGKIYNLKEKDLLLALFTAGGLGEIVSKKINLSGAEGGCQAECGVASAMAAGAAVELLGGRPNMVSSAFALALKNLLGLTCDPVAGLVEIPCVKRNGFAASHAITAAFMALAGVKSIIPADQVIDAMCDTGKLMPTVLKERAQAGLAVTPTACEISDEFGI
ncbi:MAG: L-serine ammonia-lyase, iron-sulfur-dependent, subunit beta, partial [Halanaerobiales bacterium]